MKPEKQMTKKLEPHHFRMRTYYADTDAAGAIFHTRYLEFCERARWELFVDRGVDLRDFTRQGNHFAITRVAANFHQLGRLGEELQIETDLLSCRRASLTFKQSIYGIRPEEDKRLLCEAEFKIAYLNDKLKPQRMPQAITEVLQTTG